MPAWWDGVVATEDDRADPASLTKQDFEALARFRFGIRRYLRFSEETVRSHGVTPQHYQLLLALKGFPEREWATVRELADRLQRSPGVARVRQIAMYVAHVVLEISMREVGEGFGRDRTTVLHACHQIEDLRDDEEFDAIVATFERVAKVAFGQPETQART